MWKFHIKIELCTLSGKNQKLLQYCHQIVKWQMLTCFYLLYHLFDPVLTGDWHLIIWSSKLTGGTKGQEREKYIPKVIPVVSGSWPQTFCVQPLGLKLFSYRRQRRPWFNTLFQQMNLWPQSNETSNNLFLKNPKVVLCVSPYTRYWNTLGSSSLFPFYSPVGER